MPIKTPLEAAIFASTMKLNKIKIFGLMWEAHGLSCLVIVSCGKTRKNPGNPGDPGGAALVAEALVVLQWCQNCGLKLCYYHEFGSTS